MSISDIKKHQREIEGQQLPPLPPILYHGTSEKVWKKVMEHGLKGFDYFANFGAYSFFGDNPVICIWYADNAAKYDKSKPIILMITPTTDLDMEMEQLPSPGKVWKTKTKIPPDRISVFRKGKDYYSFRDEAYK